MQNSTIFLVQNYMWQKIQINTCKWSRFSHPCYICDAKQRFDESPSDGSSRTLKSVPSEFHVFASASVEQPWWWTEKLAQETVGSGRAVERQAWYKGIEPSCSQFQRVVHWLLGVVQSGIVWYCGERYRHGIKGSSVLAQGKKSPELWLKHPLNWLENDITDILPLKYVSFDQDHDLAQKETLSPILKGEQWDSRLGTWWFK